ncbi:hypothetical protein PAMP_014553 [Pampus punctatissimus]
MSSTGGGSPLRVHAVRFGPGQELLASLQAFVEENRLRAPFIITCVGSVTKATLRLANATAANTNEVAGSSVQACDVLLMITSSLRSRLWRLWKELLFCRHDVMMLAFPQVIHLSGRFEIVSLVGTLNQDAHVHICLSDSEGKTVGGHVMGDLEVFTTAEVVVGEAVDLQFTRELDERTGFPELVVQPCTDE